MCAALATINSNAPSLRSSTPAPRSPPSRRACIGTPSTTPAGPTSPASSRRCDTPGSPCGCSSAAHRPLSLCAVQAGYSLWITSMFTPPHLCRRRGASAKAKSSTRAPGQDRPSAPVGVLRLLGPNRNRDLLHRGAPTSLPTTHASYPTGFIQGGSAGRPVGSRNDSRFRPVPLV